VMVSLGAVLCGTLKRFLCVLNFFFMWARVKDVCLII
jgi:hypothetical protein